MKVNFMIVGAMKSGTSTLSKILNQHPGITMSEPMEPHFFSMTENWQKNLERYQKRNFKEGNNQLYGEGSTTYTMFPHYNLELWKDIYNYNPEMKFIYLIRNPIERAISQYMHLYERGYLNSSIEDALINEPWIINTGRYFTQIKPFIDLFGKENVYIIDFEDLIYNRQDVIKNVSNFLNIEFDNNYFDLDIYSNKSIGQTKINKKFDFLVSLRNKYLAKINLPKKVTNILKKLWNYFIKQNTRKFYKKPELTYEYKSMIINLTKLDIIELERITGKDFSKWYNNN